MKGIFLPLLFIAFLSQAQKRNESFYAFDKDWKSVNELEGAAYFMHKVKENDTTYVCRYYQTKGPMVLWETYKDEKQTIAHGLFAWYNTEGKLDSSGYYFNDYKNDKWQYNFDDSSKPRIVDEFELGTLIKRTNYTRKLVLYPNGTKLSLDSIEASKDTLKDGSIKIPAKYKGDLKGWSEYLSKNIQTPLRFMQISGPDSQCAIIVEFLIDKKGKVSNVFIHKSCEWSVDMETMRVIKESPGWQPATINGQPVLYRHKQSVTHNVKGY
jgi:antitoxin component YwqK of YwqJK toxin-antitoxin module